VTSVNILDILIQIQKLFFIDLFFIYYELIVTFWTF